MPYICSDRYHGDVIRMISFHSLMISSRWWKCGTWAKRTRLRPILSWSQKIEGDERKTLFVCRTANRDLSQACSHGSVLAACAQPASALVKAGDLSRALEKEVVDWHISQVWHNLQVATGKVPAWQGLSQSIKVDLRISLKISNGMSPFSGVDEDIPTPAILQIK